MGKAIMGAVVSLDGFIADDNDDPGPLFDWHGNGDVTWRFPGAGDEAPHHPGLGRLHAEPVPRHGGGGYRTAAVRPD
jgi:hypothetical protein